MECPDPDSGCVWVTAVAGLLGDGRLPVPLPGNHWLAELLSVCTREAWLRPGPARALVPTGPPGLCVSSSRSEGTMGRPGWGNLGSLAAGPSPRDCCLEPPSRSGGRVGVRRVWADAGAGPAGTSR